MAVFRMSSFRVPGDIDVASRTGPSRKAMKMEANAKSKGGHFHGLDRTFLILLPSVSHLGSPAGLSDSP
ncbi:hypothetical protein N7468_003772 [Penicillium chermesinum]|uniref:Uncharacterized protein n=1 Tax=Penicillium chermesinum TaxID=63820 RepID=A0A9W9TSJ8_9EURO|nr:uncharacterized protein N7468_003772 [Penicillium chermesinum]KAJ5239153.1 hypothetical protein N7468_003772 [Penicillium chermesinum]